MEENEKKQLLYIILEYTLCRPTLIPYHEGCTVLYSFYSTLKSFEYIIVSTYFSELSLMYCTVQFMLYSTVYAVLSNLFCTLQFLKYCRVFTVLYRGESFQINIRCGFTSTGWTGIFNLAAIKCLSKLAIAIFLVVIFTQPALRLVESVSREVRVSVCLLVPFLSALIKL